MNVEAIYQALSEQEGTTDALAGSVTNLDYRKLELEIERTAITDIVIRFLLKKIPASAEDAKNLHSFSKFMLSVTNPKHPVILGAMTYLDRYFLSKIRFNESDPLIHYRLYLVVFLLSYKYINERSVVNQAWCKACGEIFTLQEINSLERKFLACIKFDLILEDDLTQESWLDTIRQFVEEEEVKLKDTASRNSEAPSLTDQSSHISVNSSTGSQMEKVGRRAKPWHKIFNLFKKPQKIN